MKTCTTHHHACDCREAKFSELERDNAKLRELLTVAKCPECDGSGVVVRMVGSTQHVSRDMAQDAGDMTLEGSVFCEPHPEHQQCEWCAHKNSILNPS